MFLLSLFSIPSVIASALSFAAPILQGLIQFGSWYLGNLWDGLKVILSNLSTLVVLATVAIGSGFYGAKIVNCAPSHIAEQVKPPNIKFKDVFSFDK